MLFPIFPVISAATAGVILLIQQILMITVGAHRGGAKVGAGTGGDTALERKIRRHGNLAENAPIFLLGLTFLELSEAPIVGVVILGGLFVVARLLHVFAFASTSGSHLTAGSKAFPAMRSVGAIGTALLGLVTGGWLLARLWSGI